MHFTTLAAIMLTVMLLLLPAATMWSYGMETAAPGSPAHWPAMADRACISTSIPIGRVSPCGISVSKEPKAIG